MDVYEWSLIVSAFVFGAIMGSFLNVVIFRLPLGRSIIRPRSSCPACKAPVARCDNIPVVSYFLLRGKCRCCKARIAARYPLVELISALAAAGIVWRYGLSLQAAWI